MELAAVLGGPNRGLFRVFMFLFVINASLRLVRRYVQGPVGHAHGLPALTIKDRTALPSPIRSLLEELEAGGDFTLFAPSQEAFEEWVGLHARRSDRKEALAAMLADHVLQEVLTVEDVPDHGLTVTMSSGRQVSVQHQHSRGGLLEMDGVGTFKCNREAGEGVVHLLDGMLSATVPANQGSKLRGHESKGVDDGGCSHRGLKLHGPGGGRCRCAALYTGPSCDRVRETPTAWGRGFQGFAGPVVLNVAHLAGLQELRAVTPGKDLTILSNISAPVREQLSTMLPQKDAVGNSQFESCALVGGAGILLRSKAGAEIDRHSMVLRFNSAPARGYEAHVGARTTFRICNGEHLNFREGNETIIHHLKAKSFLTKLMLYNTAAKATRAPLVFDPDFTSYVASTLRFIPSSGYFAIMMALQVCSKIRLYGFFASERHGTRHHYFNSEVPSNARRDDSEYLVVAALARNGILEFGEKCIMECHDSQASCQECLGDRPMEDLAALERWTEEQQQANEAREKRWLDAQKWDWGLEDTFAFSEARGVYRKPPRPEPAGLGAAGAAVSAGGKPSRSRSSASSSRSGKP